MANELQKIIDRAVAESGCADHPCAVLGHSWKHIGGRNAGCSDACGCSIPVHDCDACGDCDYGENAEADETLARCHARRDEPLTYVQQ